MDRWSSDPYKCEYITYALENDQNDIAEFMIWFISPTLNLFISNKCKYYPDFYELSKNTKPNLSIPQDCLDLIELELNEETSSSINKTISNGIKEIKKALESNELDKPNGLLIKYGTFVQIKDIFFNLEDSATRLAAVKHGNLEMVKLLVKHGDCICEANHVSGMSIPTAARAAGHDEIADYLENLQLNRYQQLFADGGRQIKRKTFMLGTFFDTNSHLYQNMTQQASIEDIDKISKSILAKI